MKTSRFTYSQIMAILYNQGMQTILNQSPKSHPTLLVAGILYLLMLILSSFKSLESTFIWALDDKGLHFLFYFLFTGMVYFGYSGVHWFKRFAVVLIIVSFLAAFDEGLQYLTNRDPSLDDWLADLAGVYISLFLLIGAQLVLKIGQALHSRQK